MDSNLIGVVGVVLSVVIGMMTIGFGQVFSALREIALNTRVSSSTSTSSQPVERTQYAGLNTIANVMTVLGCIQMFGGLAVCGMILFR